MGIAVSSGKGRIPPERGKRKVCVDLVVGKKTRRRMGEVVVVVVVVVVEIYFFLINIIVSVPRPLPACPSWNDSYFFKFLNDFR